MIKKIWSDPVGSQIIANLIINTLSLQVFISLTAISWAQVWADLYNIKISIVYVVLEFGILLILHAYYKRATNQTKPAQNQISSPNYTRDKFGIENLTWDW